MTKSNTSAIITPYWRYIQADSEAGRADAQHLIVSQETLLLDPADKELQQNFAYSFGVWLKGFEDRLGGSS